MPIKFTKSFLFIILVLVIQFVFQSCENEYLTPPTMVVTDVSFNDDIIPFFNSSCNKVGCHSAGFIPLDLSQANAYNELINKNLIDTVNPSASKLYTKINTGGSMADHSNSTKNNLVLVWITEGAKDN